jgi:hypothetical protein
VGAFGFQAAAFAYGGLLVVQPLLVSGLVVALMFAARWSGRRLHRAEWVSAIVLCAGLATFLVEASPTGVAQAPIARWLGAGSVVLTVIIIARVFARRFDGRVRAALLELSAGALSASRHRWPRPLSIRFSEAFPTPGLIGRCTPSRCCRSSGSC